MCTLVLRCAEGDDDSVDYLLTPADALFGISIPPFEETLRNTRKTIDRPLLDEACTIRDMVGDKWSDTTERLLIPTKEETSAISSFLQDASDRSRSALRSISLPIDWTMFKRYERRVFALDSRRKPPSYVIVVSREGRNMISCAEEWIQLCTMISDPAASGGIEIGRGSEGIVYRILWNGHDCALKVINEEAQEQLARISKESLIWAATPYYTRPNFLLRVDVLRRIVEILKDIPDLPLSLTGVKEYAFGHDFCLMEYVPDTLSLDEFCEENSSYRAALDRFHAEYGMPDSEGFLDDIKCILCIAWYRQCGGRVSLLPLLNSQHILIRGSDAKTGHLRAILIDQGEKPPSYPHDAHGLIEYSNAAGEYERVRKGFEVMCRNPKLAPFIARHLPDGIPPEPQY